MINKNCKKIIIITEPWTAPAAFSSTRPVKRTFSLISFHFLIKQLIQLIDNKQLTAIQGMDFDEEILSYCTLLGPNHKQFCQSEVNSAMSIYSNN